MLLTRGASRLVFVKGADTLQAIFLIINSWDRHDEGVFVAHIAVGP